MKTLAFSLGVVVLALSLNACSFNAEKYSKNESAASSYLGQKKTSSRYSNVEGTWYTTDWGMVFLNQEGSKVNGRFGDYEVKGVVSGRNVYLVLHEGDWSYYTLELRKNASGDLVGFYSSDIPFSESGKEEVTLSRIER